MYQSGGSFPFVFQLPLSRKACESGITIGLDIPGGVKLLLQPFAIPPLKLACFVDRRFQCYATRPHKRRNIPQQPQLHSRTVASAKPQKSRSLANVVLMWSSTMSQYQVSPCSQRPPEKRGADHLWSPAYCELYTVFSAIFRRFDMDLHETT